MILPATAVVAGTAAGPVARLAPLSFWGGYDPESGRVTDRSHPALGRSLAGTVLTMEAGRGSSSSSSVLAEAIRLGTAPAAIVLSRPDPILATGAMVAEALYGRICPVVVVAPEAHAMIADGRDARIIAAGDGWAVFVESLEGDAKKPPA